MAIFPLPGMGRAVVAVPAPGQGPGWWAGASSAAADPDGGFVVGYRVRNGHDGIDQTVIARSPDGERFTTVAILDQSRFGAQWMERPAARPHPRRAAGGSTSAAAPPRASTGGSRSWRPTTRPAWPTAEARPRLPGDDRTAVKDPIVQLRDGRWHAWICCHPLDVPGAEDRMSTGLRHQRRRLDLGLARHRPDRAAGGVGRPRRPAHHRPARRPGRLRRARHGRGELVRAHRPGRPPGGWRALRPGRGLAGRRRPLPRRRSPSPTAASASGTRPGCPTSATSCAPSASPG